MGGRAEAQVDNGEEAGSAGEERVKKRCMQKVRREEEEEESEKEHQEVEGGEGGREMQIGEEGKEQEGRRAGKGPGRKPDQEYPEGRRTGGR